jgi:hypothetical protein
MSLNNPMTPPGIDPGTVRLVAQRLNHCATPGPYLSGYPNKNFSVQFQFSFCCVGATASNSTLHSTKNTQHSGTRKCLLHNLLHNRRQKDIPWKSTSSHAHASLVFYSHITTPIHDYLPTQSRQHNKTLILRTKRVTRHRIELIKGALNKRKEQAHVWWRRWSLWEWRWS